MKELKAPGTNTHLAWLCIQDTVVRGHLFSLTLLITRSAIAVLPLIPPLGNRREGGEAQRSVSQDCEESISVAVCSLR